MDIKDFTRVKLFDYFGETNIWGKSVGIGVDCDCISLETALPMINKLIAFIDDGMHKIVASINEDKHILNNMNFAASWSGTKQADNSYVIFDDARVRLPITAEDLFYYLRIDGIVVSAVGGKDIVSASVYFVTKPDFLKKSTIKFVIDSDGSIELKGREEKKLRGYSFENKADFTRNFDAIYQKKVKKGNGFLKTIPNPDLYPLSNWTYSDMKREYELSVELFKEMGYSDEECLSTAYRCVTMSIHHHHFARTLTEMLMARTIDTVYRIKHHLYRNTKWYKDVYIDRLVKEYHDAPAKGFVLSAKEKANFEHDIDFVINHIDAFPVDERIPQSWVEKNEPLVGIEFTNLELGRNLMNEICKHIDPDPKMRLQKMREALSPAAFALITEYNFGKTDADLFEQYVLRPLGFKMTEQLRRFLELYDGTVFAYQTHSFGIDYKYSCDNFDGYMVNAEDYIAVGTDGKYYINTMHELCAGDFGPFIGCDGKIYGYVMGCLCPMADSMEALLEEHAHKRALEEAFVARRRELDNKYLIPEVRVSSM